FGMTSGHGGERPRRRKILNCVVVETWATDGDGDVGPKGVGISCQSDKWNVALPSRGPRAIGGNPDCTIGFPTIDKPGCFEAPRIVLRHPAAKSGAQRIASQPAGDLLHRSGIVSAWQRQTREARVSVQVVHQPAQHLDGEIVVPSS